MTTFGKTDVGEILYQLKNFAEVASKYSLTEEGVVTSISVWVPKITLPETYILAIYSDDAVNNKPDVLLVETPEMELTQVDFWLTVEIPHMTLSPGKYWLAFKRRNSEWGRVNADSGFMNQTVTKAFEGWTPFSNPFPTPSGYFDIRTSIYAMYTPTTPAPPIPPPIPLLKVGIVVASVFGGGAAAYYGYKKLKKEPK